MKLWVVLPALFVTFRVWGTPVYSGQDTTNTHCEWVQCAAEDRASSLPETVDYNMGLSSAYCSSIIYKCAYGVNTASSTMTGLWHARLKTCAPGKCAPGCDEVTVNPTDAGGISSQPAGCPVSIHAPIESVLTVSYTTCLPHCSKTASDCKTTDFVAYTTSKERRAKTATLDTSVCECKYTYDYRCAAGYWGDPGTNGTGTCTKCDAITDAAGTVHTGTSVAGSNTTQSSCYIPKDESIKDVKGTFLHNQNCPF